MEKRHLGLVLRIGGMVALLALAVGYSPNPISAGSQEKRIPPGATMAALLTPWDIRRPSRLTRQM